MAADPLPSPLLRSSHMAVPTTGHQPASSPPPSGRQAQAQAHRQAHDRRKARAKVKSEALRQREAAQVEALPVQHPHAAGRHIGSRSHWGRDCQWIYRLHSVGLLAAAFRPDEKTCQLRAYLRQRGNLIRQASKHVQHMQKALEQMNLKLTEILSDITGLTGRAILRAILRGTRSPEKLAKYRDKGCKASEAEIAQALTGS